MRSFTLAELENVLERSGMRSEGTTRRGATVLRRGELYAELEGDPVHRLSVVASPSADLGRVVNVLTELLSEDPRGHKAWAQRELETYARRVRLGRAVDAAALRGDTRMRLQSLGRLMVVTWEAR